MTPINPTVFESERVGIQGRSLPGYSKDKVNQVIVTALTWAAWSMGDRLVGAYSHFLALAPAKLFFLTKFRSQIIHCWTRKKAGLNNKQESSVSLHTEYRVCSVRRHKCI